MVPGAATHLLAGAPRNCRRAAAPCGVLVFLDAPNVGSLGTIELVRHVDVVAVNGGGAAYKTPASGVNRQQRQNLHMLSDYMYVRLQARNAETNTSSTGY